MPAPAHWRIFRCKVPAPTCCGSLASWRLTATSRICAPIHDAIAVEAASTEIADVVRDMAHCMVEASRAVLGGPAIRIDPKILLFPDRYVDGRDGSTELWATVTRLLQRLQEQAA